MHSGTSIEREETIPSILLPCPLSNSPTSQTTVDDEFHSSAFPFISSMDTITTPDAVHTPDAATLLSPKENLSIHEENKDNSIDDGCNFTSQNVNHLLQPSSVKINMNTHYGGSQHKDMDEPSQNPNDQLMTVESTSFDENTACVDSTYGYYRNTERLETKIYEPTKQTESTDPLSNSKPDDDQGIDATDKSPIDEAAFVLQLGQGRKIKKRARQVLTPGYANQSLPSVISPSNSPSGTSVAFDINLSQSDGFPLTRLAFPDPAADREDVNLQNVLQEPTYPFQQEFHYSAIKRSSTTPPSRTNDETSVEAQAARSSSHALREVETVLIEREPPQSVKMTNSSDANVPSDIELYDLKMMKQWYSDIVEQAKRSLLITLESDSISIGKMIDAVQDEEKLKHHISMKEALQLEHAELEQFEEAAKLDELIKDMKKMLLDIESEVLKANLGQKKVADSWVSLTNDYLVDTKLMLTRLYELKDKKQIFIETSTREQKNLIERECMDLKEERDANEMSILQMNEEKERLEKDMEKVYDSIKKQTKALEIEVDELEVKEESVRQTIEGLEKQLEIERAYQKELHEKINSNKKKIASVEVKHSKRLRIIADTELNLKNLFHELQEDQIKVDKSLAELDEKKIEMKLMEKENDKWMDDYYELVNISSQRLTLASKLMEVENEWKESVGIKVDRLAAARSLLQECQNRTDAAAREVEICEGSLDSFFKDLNALQNRISEAKAVKKAAIENRSFKEAGRITAALKELGGTAEDMSQKLSNSKAELAAARENHRKLKEEEIELQSEYEAKLHEHAAETMRDVETQMEKLKILEKESSGVCHFLSDIIHEQIRYLTENHNRLCEFLSKGANPEGGEASNKNEASNEALEFYSAESRLSGECEEYVKRRNEVLGVDAASITGNMSAKDIEADLGLVEGKKKMLEQLHKRCEEAIGLENFDEAASIDEEIRLIESELTALELNKSGDEINVEELKSLSQDSQKDSISAEEVIQ